MSTNTNTTPGHKKVSPIAGEPVFEGMNGETIYASSVALMQTPMGANGTYLCAICGDTTDMAHPVYPVAGRHQQVICDTCLGDHAPELHSLLDVYRAATKEPQRDGTLFDMSAFGRYESEPPLIEHVRNHAYQLQFLQGQVQRLEQLLHSVYGPDSNGNPFTHNYANTK